MNVRKCAAPFLVLLTAAMLNPARAAELNSQRARYHYQVFCQGCHTPDGSGAAGVPRLKNFMGNFLKSEEGRRYLVRVPGSANAPLDDAMLAELLNWAIESFAGDSAPAQWRPYSAREVGEYRADPLMRVEEAREALLKEITGDAS